MRPADLRFEIRDDVLHARLVGELDMSNVEELRDALTVAVPNTAAGVVLDLGEIDYIDSAGIHLIYRLREILRVRGQRLVLVIPSESIVNDALRLAGIERRTGVVETMDDGFAALHARDSWEAP